MYQFRIEDAFSLALKVGADAKQKNDELFFKYCPYCFGGNHDINTFSINLENGTFKCFRASCGKQGHFAELARDFNFPLEKDEKPTYRTLPQKEIVTKPKAVEYLQSRGISERITRKYKITVHKSNNNILIFPFYDEEGVLQFVKYRNMKFDGKGNKEWCEKNTKPILFGMAQCTDFDRLIITEGQIDSLSVAECGFPNVVSVPTGAKGFTWITHCWEWITKFKEVVVFGDNEKGQITLIDELSKKLPMTVKCVRNIDYLCEKDANDILLKYGKEAIIKAINNAELREVKFVKRLANVKAVDMQKLPKIKTGIYEIDKAIGGLFYGQVILLSGKRGEGKSTLMSQFAAEAIEQDNPVFVYSGELPNYHFKNWLDLQIAGGKHISTHFNEYGDEQYYLSDEVTKTINRWYFDKAFIFDNTAVEDDEYEGILKIITDAVCRYNIKLVCIDNLMTALDDNPQTDIYRQQSSFVKSLAKIAKKFDIAIILIAHPKKSNTEFNNDTVSGSSDITNAVDVVMNYERCYDGIADSKITITKNRLTGRILTGPNAIELVYSEKSKRIQSSKYFNRTKEYSCFIKTDDFDEITENLNF
ncbi:MAG: hypothetical protein E7536_09110 [Ruminococcaceae bacterium]|nr:hypothetical protein [Oscillospiraceae bacterium]